MITIVAKRYAKALVELAHEKKVVDQTRNDLAAFAEVDITERKHAEDALRGNEEMYRSLFENMPFGLAYCEMHFDMNDKPDDFTYRVVNSAFETLTGLGNVVGRKATEVNPGMRETDPQLFEILAGFPKLANLSALRYSLLRCRRVFGFRYPVQIAVIL